MKQISLTQGKVALVDDEDYERLNRFKWYAQKARNTFYAFRMLGRGKMVLMHRDILNTPEGMVPDHIDGNGLNNQKSNIRIVTVRQNAQNLHIKKSSRYPGVSPQNKAWRARIKINGLNIELGMFPTEEEAHEAYLKAIPGHR